MSTSDKDLVTEFKKIKENHERNIQVRASMAVTGSSVIRVFEKGTKPELTNALQRIDLMGLSKIENKDQFEKWYLKQLNKVHNAVLKKNKRNSRVMPGLKWGHATKVLSLFLRNITCQSEYFSNTKKRDRVRKFLYVPIDSQVVSWLKRNGISRKELGFNLIKEIDTKEKFFFVQNKLYHAAEKTNVPMIWFDDAWVDRKN